MRVDLNGDLGEGFPWDEELMGLVTSANVCCGGHAGGREESLRALRWAGDRGVVIGAHPGYPDREHFGRRDVEMGAGEVAEMVAGQVDWLAGLAREAGVGLSYVKPHGALYNRAQRDGRVAGAVVGAIAGTGLAVLGMPGGEVERAALGAGVRFVGEGFADRRYTAEGRLVARSEPGAMLEGLEEIGEQVVRLIRGGIETICLHGDEAGAVKRARRLRELLAALGVEVRAWGR